MDMAKLQELANEFAKDIKTQHVLIDFSKILTKLMVETALNAELTEHLGYETHQNSPEDVKNARHGTTKKPSNTQLNSAALIFRHHLHIVLGCSFIEFLKNIYRVS